MVRKIQWQEEGVSVRGMGRTKLIFQETVFALQNCDNIRASSSPNRTIASFDKQTERDE